MFSQTSMGLIYLIFNQLPFLWDTSVVNHNDTVLKLKEPVEERTFQFKSIIAFYDPPLYIFRKEGSNARFLESIID